MGGVLRPVAFLTVCSRGEPHREQSGKEHQFLRQEHDGAHTDHIWSVQ